MYQFTSEERELVIAWNLHQETKVNIKYSKSGLKEDSSIENFLSILSEAAPSVIIDNKPKGENRLPEIIISDHIKYSAIPLAKELRPFLNALSASNNGEQAKLSEKVQKNLENIDIPLSLTLFVSQTCPHCPILVEGMLDIIRVCNNISLTIIDPTIFTKVAEANSVMSVPCLILNDDFRWTGKVSLEEITDVLVNQDSSNLKAVTLRRILEDGKASWIVEQMIERNMIFPEFIKLAVHELWSVRLGAMVVIEELAENNIDLAQKICPFLWEAFPNAPDDVKGDIFYAIGEAGNLEDLELTEIKLKTIKGSDLRDAAKDAIQTIRLRF